MAKDPQIPAHYQTVMPYLIIKDAAKFIDFTKEVFDALLVNNTMRNKDIIMHAEVIIGESTIMFADATEKFKPQAAGLFVYVANADETYVKALECGGRIITNLSDHPYGRCGGITDPFGNSWWITSVIK